MRIIWKSQVSDTEDITVQHTTNSQPKYPIFLCFLPASHCVSSVFFTKSVQSIVIVQRFT